MAKIKYIPCDMWKRGVYAFIGSLSEFKDWVLNETKEEWSDDFLDMVRGLDKNKIGLASCNYDDGTSVILMPKFPKTPKELAYVGHEILHATFVMLDYCGVEYIKHTSHETFTYLYEHIARNVYEKIGYKEFDNKKKIDGKI